MTVIMHPRCLSREQQVNHNRRFKSWHFKRFARFLQGSQPSDEWETFAPLAAILQLLSWKRRKFARLTSSVKWFFLYFSRNVVVSRMWQVSSGQIVKSREKIVFRRHLNIMYGFFRNFEEFGTVLYARIKGTCHK